MHLKFNSLVDYPEKKLVKVQHFLQASSLIFGKHRHRSDVTRTSSTTQLLLLLPVISSMAFAGHASADDGMAGSRRTVNMLMKEAGKHPARGTSPRAEKEFRSNQKQNIKKVDQNREEHYLWFY